MFTQTTPTLGSGLLATILADESFRPSEPNSLPETSLPNSLIESLLINKVYRLGFFQIAFSLSVLLVEEHGCGF